METTFKTQHRVKFSDTDMAGIAHFSNYFKYMEEVEHAFLRSRGLSVVLDDPKGKLGFPKLGANCDYKRPTKYDEVLDVDCVVSCNNGKSIRYEFTFSSSGDVVASGHLHVAFCRFPSDRAPYALPVEERVLEKMFAVTAER